jgi:hypothetical protein
MADQLGATLDGLESKVNERTVDLEDAKLQAESAPPQQRRFSGPYEQRNPRCFRATKQRGQRSHADGRTGQPGALFKVRLIVVNHWEDWCLRLIFINRFRFLGAHTPATLLWRSP